MINNQQPEWVIKYNAQQKADKAKKDKPCKCKKCKCNKEEKK